MTMSAYPSPGSSGRSATRRPAGPDSLAARAVLAVDPAGAITAWGGSAEEMFGYRPEEVLGRSVGMLLPPTVGDEEMPLRRALEGEVVDSVVTERLAKAGDVVPVAVSAAPTFAGGAVTGAVGSYTDLRTYERTEARLRLVLDTTQDAYVAIDAGGHILDWNPAAELLFGWSQEEVLGRLLHETIIPPRMRAAHLHGLRHYRSGDASRIVGGRVELCGQRRDGTEVPVELSVAPIDLGGGELVFTAFMRDISERTRAREELEASREHLLEAQLLARLGSWEWDLATGEVTVSDELARIFDRPAKSMNAREVLATVHPADAERVRGESRAAIDGGAPFVSDFRIVRPDGDVRFLQGRGRIVRDLEGRAIRMVGTDLDITDRVRGEAATRRLAAVVASTDDAVMTATLDGVITSWNAAAQRLYGYPSEMAVGQAVGMLVPPQRTGEEERIIEEVRLGERVQGHETQHLTRDGRVIDVSLTVSAIREDDGRVVEIAKIVRDIGARKAAERELGRYTRDLEALAREDALTGLLTRREFHGALDQALDRADRLAATCAIVLLDVDGLRGVNEREGRAAGDDLLRGLARHVRRNCAADHVVCRVGGDEIGIVLPAASAEQAAILVRRLSAGWARTQPAAGIRAGAATWPQEAADKDGLLACAAAAVRRTKSAQGTHPSSPPVEVRLAGAETADRIVALLRRHLGMEMAYLAEFSEGRQIVRNVDAGPEHPRLAAGSEVDLGDTYCRRMVDGDLPNVIADTALEPVTAALGATREGAVGSYVGVPVRLSDGRLYGSLCAISREPDARLDPTAANFARVCARFIGDLLDQRELEEENRRLQSELVGVRSLLVALDARDRYTGEHSEAVVALAGAVARRLALRAPDSASVEQVARLHDIGKIGVPDAILHKEGPLTDAEWVVMKQHPVVGARIVASIPSLAALAPAIRAEHERWDGGGYPDGLAGEDIPLAARIVLACDAYHAMTSDRPYRAALPVDRALAELHEHAGTQFDPVVAQALLAVLGS